MILPPPAVLGRRAKIMRKGHAMIDVSVPLVCLALAGMGLMALYSVSLAMGKNWAERQVLSLLIAMVAAGGIFWCSLSSLRRWVRVLMFTVLLLLAAVFLFEPRYGAHRWLYIGMSLQPVELCKWAVLLLAAHFSSRPQFNRCAIKFIKPVALWLLPALVLIYFQRDFGSLMLIITVVLAILFMAGFNFRVLLVLSLLAAFLAAMMIWTESYRMQRLLIFVNPFADLLGNGYNQSHAIIAFLRGGLFGVGLGRSIERWGYLPEMHNDFIIAIITEEMGLVGFLAVCALLSFLVFRAISIGQTAERRGEVFGALYAYGFAVLIGAQAVINMSGSLALTPSKGFTLPLVSYGGSSLLSMGLLVGVLLRIDWENRQEQTAGGI